MVTLLGARAAATTRSLGAHGRNFGRLLRRNAARRWERLRRSKASLDGHDQKHLLVIARSARLRLTLFVYDPEACEAWIKRGGLIGQLQQKELPYES